MRFAWMPLALGLLDGCAPGQPVPDPAYASAPAGPNPPVLGASQPGPPPGIFAVDSELAHLIRRTIKEDEHLSGSSRRIKVRVHKGVVTLRGTVQSSRERDELIDRISKMPGVDEVDDRLEVASNEARKVYSPSAVF